MKQYKSIRDFLMDDSFFRYVIKKEQPETAQWEAYLAQHPEHQELAKKAKAELLNIRTALTIIDAEENFKQLLPHIASDTVALHSKKRWTYYVAASIVFLFLTGASIWFFQFRSNNQAQISYTTKPAEKRSITLPDGTLAKLNADSKIEIMEGFGETNRAVKLSGEVYLEVAKNKDLPFILSTDVLVVRVLGTTLNIRAYNNENTETASLLEGSAEVLLKNKDISPIRLKPMEKVIASIEETRLNPQESSPFPEGATDYQLTTMTTYDAESGLAETSWTEQKLVFINEPLQEIAKTLERWYNVKIEFQDEEIKDRKYTAAFDEREELQSVLESLRVSLPFRYEKVGPRKISIKLTNQ